MRVPCGHVLNKPPELESVLSFRRWVLRVKLKLLASVSSVFSLWAHLLAHLSKVSALCQACGGCGGGCGGGLRLWLSPALEKWCWVEMSAEELLQLRLILLFC